MSGTSIHSGAIAIETRKYFTACQNFIFSQGITGVGNIKSRTARPLMAQIVFGAQLVFDRKTQVRYILLSLANGFP